MYAHDSKGTNRGWKAHDRLLAKKKAKELNIIGEALKAGEVDAEHHVHSASWHDWL